MASIYFFLCLHLLIISDILFSMLSSLCRALFVLGTIYEEVYLHLWLSVIHVFSYMNRIVSVFSCILYKRKYGSEKARILTYFMSCKMWNMFKVNNKDTRMRIVNGKADNKDTVDFVLVSLLLNLTTFRFLLQYFYFWLFQLIAGWVVACPTLCACWNRFRQSFHLWGN